MNLSNFLNLINFNSLFVFFYHDIIWVYYSISLFVIGACGVFLSRRNIIILIMSIEIMLLAINFNFICFSIFLDNLLGEMLSLFLLTVGASESAIGLALVVSYYKTFEQYSFINS
uniref:NADH dehydrogenase subunit 4L n=1 Tax=Eukaryota sp. BB2 TaxID=1949062 RepID=A0A1W5QGC3_9EUKA|nr:NADH dehydrogenase subunit 4L [Eukaryota sp. BB2]AQL10450.1 NADH dehydrogenase subunit 4L [Eukaryota sp. BB2]